MQYDPNNNIVKLCAEGMNLEGQGKREEAVHLFFTAWEEATDNLEKFTAAHYVARHQASVSDKLRWDLMALNHASKIDDESIKALYPSLYLNIAKGYEDLEDYEKAKMYYRLAKTFSEFLIEDGYGSMIKRGIAHGMERTNQADISKNNS